MAFVLVFCVKKNGGGSKVLLETYQHLVNTGGLSQCIVFCQKNISLCMFSMPMLDLHSSCREKHNGISQ